MKNEKRVIGMKENIIKRVKQLGKERENIGAEEDRNIYNKILDEIIQAVRSVEI